MSLPIVALTTASGLMNALWNLWAKGSRRPLVFLWSFQVVAVAVWAPFAWWRLSRHAVGAPGWAWLLAAITLHAIYVLVLARGYARADLSQLYPIMRGTSPLLVPVLGVVLLGENLPWLSWIGIFLVGLGVLAVAGIPSHAALTRGKYLGVLVGLAITAYTVVDKITLHYVPAVALAALGNAGNALALTLPALRAGATLQEWRAHLRLVVAAGILSPASYLLFLWALSQAPVAAVAPMRETGIVFGTLLGVFVLHEAHGTARVLGSLLIAAGVAVLALHT